MGRVSWRARGSVGLGVPPPAGYPGPGKLRLQVPAGCAVGCGVARVLCVLRVPDYKSQQAMRWGGPWRGTNTPQIGLEPCVGFLGGAVRPRGVPGTVRAQLP